MQSSDFVHLHVHSDYSLLDGACSVDKLASTAKKMHMPAVAITDHGNMFGAIPFYTKVSDKGVKPIIGLEAYIAPGSRFSREVSAAKGEGAFQHLVLLARDNTGYHNLIKLATAGYLEGFYYRPRIDKEILAEHSEGLICLSACLGGELPQHILHDRHDRARECAGFYRDLFGRDGYFLEVMNHDMPEQKKVTEELVKLGRELDLKLVATNDCHYMTAEDAEAHEVLMCINTGKFLDDEKRMSFESTGYHFRSGEEMADRFRHLPEAIANTRLVADSCELDIRFDEKHLPTFVASEGMDNEELFVKLCSEGLSRRYGSSPPQETKDRLEYETGVVRRMGFVSFFLVAWDLIKKAREMGVAVGPGRGSAAGSIVSYCLGITNVDPIKYGLIFERFMDEARNEAPDIDVDFCQDRREEVLDYIRDKYGHENVAQIITFGTMAARGVIRDVSRVLRYPLDETDKLAKMVPTTLGVTLDSALEESPDLASAYVNDPQVKRVIDIGKRLEGLARHASTHAAGMVLADKPLSEYVPLAKMGDVVTTQYAMKSLEKVGLVKIDFLGLKTLSVLERAVKTVKHRKGVDIDLDDLDLEDADTYEMLGRGESMGVFQFESSGFRDLLKRLKPDQFADLVALVALYRPGPLGGGMVDDYVRRKHGLDPVNFPHPVFEQVLSKTYGVMVYQEQVMRIVNLLGGIPMSGCYTLVKAISKKDMGYIQAMRGRFVEGAVANGFEQKKAESLFEQIEYFGGYGFNQSHSTAYALIAFQTAFLKCHHPLAFMAALMTYEMHDTDKLVVYINECRRTMDIEIFPPDVNESESGFIVADEGIRYGLAGVKGVGERAVEGIVEARQQEGPFKTLYDFCSRVDLRVVNKGVVEALVKCGAFDCLGGKRSQYSAVVDRAISAGQRMQADKQSGQSTFFDAFESSSPAEKVGENLPGMPEWTEQQLLAAEKAAIGFHLTSHPMVLHGDVVERFSNTSTDSLRSFEDGTELTIGAMLCQIRFTVTQKGKSRGERMAMLNLEDLTGKCDAVVFPSDLVRNEQFMNDGSVVFVRGRLNLRRDPPSITISEIIPLNEATERLTESVFLTLEPRHQEDQAMKDISRVLTHHHGNCGVYFKVVDENGNMTTVKADSSFAVAPSEAFTKEIESIIGEKNLSFAAIGPRSQPAGNGGRNWRRN